MKTTKLKALGACGEARTFARRKRTYQEGWEKCTRVDWAMWLLCHASEESRLIAVDLAADFAEHVLQHVPEESRRVCVSAIEESRRVCVSAIEAARAYARDPSDKNKGRCRITANAAANAANAAGAAANAAAYAAANAANAAGAAANAAAYAAANAAGAARAVEKKWQMARILEVCPRCPITEEGE